MAKSLRTSSTTISAAPARVRHLEALVEGQSQVLEKISHGMPLAQILEAIARWVEGQSRDGVLVSLQLLDAEGKHVLHGAAPSLPESYSSAIHGVAIGPAVGSCGTAAFTKRPVIVEDIASNPLWADYRELALSHGLRACWSTPLLASDGRVLGTFAMYYRQPRLPSADDYQLIRLVTRTATLAIEHQLADEERAELLGIVAHDLGNPVAAMKARVQLLEHQAKKGKPVAASALHGLGEMVGRMERLVQDLRDTESIQGGRLVLAPDTYDLNALCRQEAEAAQTAAGRPITLALLEEPAPVEADRDRIGQVIGNILSNALKYSAEGRPVELRLSREVIPADDAPTDESATLPTEMVRAYARVSVRDEGPGIPPEALTHVFERFYRAPGIDVQHGERRGLGLGLYICRQLIERHGGQVGVESEVGEGSTFWFRLPLAASPDLKEIPSASRLTPPHATE